MDIEKEGLQYPKDCLKYDNKNDKTVIYFRPYSVDALSDYIVHFQQIIQNSKNTVFVSIILYYEFLFFIFSFCIIKN